MRAGKWYFVTLLMAAAFWLAGSNCTAQEMTAEGTSVLELPGIIWSFLIWKRSCVV